MGRTEGEVALAARAQHVPAQTTVATARDAQQPVGEPSPAGAQREARPETVAAREVPGGDESEVDAPRAAGDGRVEIAAVAPALLPRAARAEVDGSLGDGEAAAPQTRTESTRRLVLLGTEVPPATATRLAWAPNQSFEGIYSATPVLVVNGAEAGPTLCLTAAVHGDELNGTETVRRILYNLKADDLKGAVIGVPIVNLQGFHSGSRYLSDRRDLNRHFPGDPRGSSASRIAYSFFQEVIQHCSAVVDLHTGSFYRTNLPQLRGDLSNPQVVKLTQSFGSTVVLHSEGTLGTLRRAAVQAGIPAVTLEAGGPKVLEEKAVDHSVKGIRTLLNHLGMLSKFSLWGDPEPVYYNSAWQRAPEGGIVFSKVQLGASVRVGDVLGTVTNPVTNQRTRIVSSYNGRVLGMALNQVVQPGFATHHIGIEAPQEQISEPAEVDAAPAAELAAPDVALNDHPGAAATAAPGGVRTEQPED
ncbi:MAG: succinylglutamate desuccinylase/aspartoacylase family protein [Halioglobus sp.]|nr:succinylglutamate desuccinylase/aspartoacylase family protein [Halioglobus sp.]